MPAVGQNGRVLARGDEFSNPTGAEILDPATRTWRTGSGMGVGRVGHTATVLADGGVLVLGGYGDAPDRYQAAAEIFHPDTGSWSSAGMLPPSRW